MTTSRDRWEALRLRPRRWFVSGVAGFIGSHLLERLLDLDQPVIGLDNFRTGHRTNLEDVERRVGPARWRHFRFVEGDITRPEDLARAWAEDPPELVLHQAALGSVPQSIENPAGTHAINVTGFLNVLVAARDARVSRVVYASSSAVYGDATEIPAREGREGKPLSPYALSKSLDESYGALFERVYGLPSIGLRYFNVFGPRQDPQGAYAAVIPRWTSELFAGTTVEIYGDGETTRDFCPVANVVEANLAAATCPVPTSGRRVFNIGLGGATSLNRLAESLRTAVARRHPPAAHTTPRHLAFRSGDIRHSSASIEAAQAELEFAPVQTLEAGLDETVAWFAPSHGPASLSGAPTEPR